MRTIHRRRKSRLRSRRAMVAWRQAWRTVSNITFQSLDRPPRYPSACLRIRLRRRRALTPLFALAIRSSVSGDWHRGRRCRLQDPEPSPVGIGPILLARPGAPVKGSLPPAEEEPGQRGDAAVHLDERAVGGDAAHAD